MEKIAGTITSKTTGNMYSVKWNTENLESWVKIKDNTWIKVCSKIYSVDDALICAQKYIDSQPDSF